MDETYNLFAQQKRQFYSGADAQGTVAGQVAGETGKQSANSLSGNSGSTIQTETAAPQLKAQPKPSLGGYTQHRSITNMDELINAMYTSPQEEDRLRKASVANQRIMAVGDALRHIGNIASTVNYAPSQTFNSPVMEEQARYERGRAMRDAANARYFSYQQQKAAQESKMQALSDATEIKMKQLAFNQDKFNRQQSLNEFKAKNDAWYKQATIEQKAEYLDIQRQLMEGRISLMDAQRALAEVKTAAGGFAPKSGSRGGRGGGMSEYTTTTETSYNYDTNGRKTGSTTTRKRTSGAAGSSVKPSNTSTAPWLKGSTNTAKAPWVK